MIAATKSHNDTKNQRKTTMNDASSNPTTNETATASPASAEDKTITNAQLATIHETLRLLHPIVQSGTAAGATWKPLPASFEACTETDYEAIFARAKHVMTQKGVAQRGEAAKGVEKSVRDILATHYATLVSKRERVAAILAENPDLAGTLTPPDSVKVQLPVLKAAFPEGTSDATAMLVLRDLGIEVNPGDQRLKTPESPFVKLSFVAPKDEAKDATKAA
jgi:hypothetical protein